MCFIVCIIMCIIVCFITVMVVTVPSGARVADGSGWFKAGIADSRVVLRVTHCQSAFWDFRDYRTLSVILSEIRIYFRLLK